MMYRRRRHYYIFKIIDSMNVESQEQLLEELNKKGVKIVQSTLSKDLKELGIIKVRNRDGTFRHIRIKKKNIYQVKEMLQTEFWNYLTEIVAVGNLVTPKTIPGHALALGKCLDEIGWPEIVSVISGTDTVLVITQTKEDANSLVNKLENILMEKQ